jgi:hypothetical protein
MLFKTKQSIAELILTDAAADVALVVDLPAYCA